MTSKIFIQHVLSRQHTHAKLYSPGSLSTLALTDMVSFLLSKGAHPDIQDKRGCTAAMLAAQLGNYAIVELLCQSHANLKLEDAEGRGEQQHVCYSRELR